MVYRGRVGDSEKGAFLTFPGFPGIPGNPRFPARNPQIGRQISGGFCPEDLEGNLRKLGNPVQDSFRILMENSQKLFPENFGGAPSASLSVFVACADYLAMFGVG